MPSMLYANDEQGKYPDSYYVASAKPLAAYPRLEGNKTFDVCVIGAGYAGLSAAISLAEKGHNVVVLEAHRVGWGASGRNGGQLGSAQNRSQFDLEKMVGDADARKLWTLAEDAKAKVHDLSKKYNIDCEYQPGIFHVDHKKRFVKHSKTEVEHLQKKYNYEHIQFLDANELRAYLGTKVYHGGSLDMGAGHLHPLKLAFGMARAAQGLGVKIYEKTEALRFNEGKNITIDTQGGAITAKHLILACNGYLGRLNKRTAARVMPINNYIIATEPLSDDLALTLISNNAAVADSKFVVNYYRLSKDKRLLFGGRESYRYRFPPDIKSFVRKPMLNIYPQLDTVKIDYGWGGTLAVTMNRMPHFEWLSPNIITISGFSGHGVGMASLSGSLAADAISGSAEKFDVMAQVPTPPMPGGTALRVPLLSLAMFYYSLRDKL